jgi:hypothetical protein
MATDVSNMARLAIANNAINFVSDTFKACLMATGFVFDVDNHEAWSDVSGYEISTGNGYTQNNKTLSSPPTISVDTSINRAKIVWANITWTASGGDIGPCSGVIIHDPSVAGSGDVVADPIIGFIEFDADITQEDGGALTISSLRIDI